MPSVRTGAAAVATGSLLLFGLAAPAAAAPPAPLKPVHHSDDTLRGAAHGSGTRIGTAVDVNSLNTNEKYREIVAREFDVVTPENEMKWSVLEPTQGTYNWAPADRLVEFAQQNGQKVRGHTLVWHSQNPSWLTEENFTKDQLRALLKKHITDVAGRYKGKIWAWDVANEIFNDDGTWRDTIWLRALGPDYIADVFRWAKKADPHAKLFLNDYNAEWVNPKTDAYYALIKKLRAQGVPIEGFGMQGHLALQYGLPTTVLENHKRFDALGIQTAYTEVDIRYLLPGDQNKTAAQAEGFGLLLRACLIVRNCVSYTVWGFSDAHSWVPGVFTGEGEATPMTADYQPKPAYYTLRDTLAIAGH